MFRLSSGYMAKPSMLHLVNDGTRELFLHDRYLEKRNNKKDIFSAGPFKTGPIELAQKRPLARATAPPDAGSVLTV
jgi:hypothetical protein